MIYQIREKKPAKWKVVVLLRTLAVIGVWYWHERSFQQLKENGKDIFFLEYEDVELDTIIYRYDVENDEVFQIAVLNGHFTNCQIDRVENCIIGFYYNKEENDEDEKSGIIKYDLMNGEMEKYLNIDEIDELSTSSFLVKLSKFEEKGTKVRLGYWDTELLYNLEEKRIETDVVEETETNKRTVFFKDNNRKKLYLYDPEKKTTRCIISAGWNCTIGEKTGLAQNGNYLLYVKHFNRFFNASDATVRIRNINSSAEKILLRRKNTCHRFEFVQEM